WVEALDRDARGPSGELAVAFGAVFAETKTRLGEDDPPIESLGPLPDEAHEPPATAATSGGSSPSAPAPAPSSAEPTPARLAPNPASLEPTYGSGAVPAPPPVLGPSAPASPPARGLRATSLQ